jgi:AcrR family transcriptional regulator
MANIFTQRGVPVGPAGVRCGSVSDESALILSGVMTSHYETACRPARHGVYTCGVLYRWGVPKMWDNTVESHRQAVRDAILDTTAVLAVDQGLASVTMSEIASRTGIGRATLYKYFSDVEAVLVAWHERHIGSHLQHLAKVRDEAGGSSDCLRAVFEAFALISYEHPNTELAAFLHRGSHVARAQHHLHGFVRDLVAEGVAAGRVRSDIEADELATYCLHALSAASDLQSMAAVQRLVQLVLSALQSSRGPGFEPTA